ncbi:MAG TPA: dual specificity protein phosphatase family protein [Vicinamibacterales bacterium]|nr:dual specificity protein phosphatase family protein [Vicinamibacterales bacterium]
MELFQVDDAGRLFISPALDCWDAADAAGIDVVIDLEGELDTCIPTTIDRCLYVYFPISDDDEVLPCETKLRAVAKMGASLVADGHRVLSHCGMGYNRSALVAAMILVELGMPGLAAIEQIRARRPGALYNDRFAAFVAGLTPSRAGV